MPSDMNFEYNVIATFESGYFKLDVIWWVLSTA